ncbi:hypothetical protein CDD83_227 [Cordyceps sp. RAO-2017]|nr:hypothetical protein CDD83_227 [Cordyceps sp. RAO-2017]
MRCPLSDEPHFTTAELPRSYYELFSSGAENSTLSSAFNIQWRQWENNMPDSHDTEEKQQPNTADFQNIKSLLLNERFDIIEGLIVDTINGGVGFRNHTVPTGLSLGAEWQEDLLFVEPETSCVDTNISLELPPYAPYIDYVPFQVGIADRDGIPILEGKRPAPDLRDARRNADLQGRARAAASLYQAMHRELLNLTSSGMALYPSPRDRTRTYLVPWEILVAEFAVSSNFSSDLELFARDNKLDELPNHPNLTQLFAHYSSSIHNICRGIDPSSKATSRDIFVHCGIVRSMTSPPEGARPEVDKGKMSYYNCASAIKAIIKTVTLTYNSTAIHLEGLKVIDVQPKQYRNKDSMPLWAVEDVGNVYDINQISPFWGIISSKYANRPNITTYRHSLYIPGRMRAAFDDSRDRFTIRESDNLAGYNFAAHLMPSAYCTNNEIRSPSEIRRNRPLSYAYDGDGSCVTIFDYHSWSSSALREKWTTLAASAKTASQIPNLIFTDIAANALAGTKGIGMLGLEQERVVTPYRTTVRIDYAYIAPAALASIATLLIILALLVHLFLRENGLVGLRRHIQRLAPGRILTTLLGPAIGDGDDLEMGGKAWNKQLGTRMFDISKTYRVAVSIGEDSQGKSHNE